MLTFYCLPPSPAEWSRSCPRVTVASSPLKPDASLSFALLYRSMSFYLVLQWSAKPDRNYATQCSMMTAAFTFGCGFTA